VDLEHPSASTIIVGALGILGTLAAAFKRRSEGQAAKDEGDAAQDKASAAGVLAMVAQIERLSQALDAEVRERRLLGLKVAELDRELGDAHAQRLHWENEARIARAERDHAIAARVAADARAEASTAELKRALLQIHGGFTHTSDMPPKAEDV
jgi:hypothetical protein